MYGITALYTAGNFGNILSELSNAVTSSNSGHHSNKLHACIFFVQDTLVLDCDRPVN